MDTRVCLKALKTFLLQIRTIQREKREHAGYSPVVDLRVKTKKIQHPPLQPLLLQEKLRARSIARGEEKPEKGFVRNSSGFVPRTFASLLVGFFLFNPLLDVYADELPLIPIEVTAAPTAAASTPQELAVATSSPENSIPPADSGTALSTTTENILPLLSEATSTEVVASTTEAAAPTPVETIASSTPIVEAVSVTAPATTTDETIVADAETGSTTDVVAEDSSTAAEVAESNLTPDDTPVLEQVETDEAIPEPPKTETAREAIVEHTPPVSAVNVIEKKYIFRENECARLDDGGFYCAPPETASTTVASNDAFPRVFAQNDAKSGGSKEIFFEDTNGKTKITDNDFDDDAPSYDRESNLVVWHSLIKGRYQIMFADAGTSTVKQLTDVSYNNTDPKVRGKSVVWQGWVENNWEIFYIKDVTNEPNAISRITTNEHPDMFPIISDNFITWQSFFGGSWHVSVYSVENGQISQISRPEAGKYENPRFALLFENRKENGEVETVGYDVVSGKEIPINAPHVPTPAAPSQGGEEDKAVPVPSGGATAPSTAVKNPGKDDDGSDSN